MIENSGEQPDNSKPADHHHAKDILLAVTDMVDCFLLVLFGALSLFYYSRGNWQVWLTGTFAIVLSISIVYRNFIFYRERSHLTKTIRVQGDVLHTQTFVIDKYRQAALSTVALKMMIEEGYPVNLRPLNRELSELLKSLTADRTKMN